MTGYKSPPINTRFKKGRSGNPKGRPKGSSNLKTDLLEELHETVPVTLNGKRQEISKQRITIKTVVAKAMKGDLRAAAKVFDLCLRLTADDELDTPGTDLSQTDQEILAAFIERYGARL